MVAITVALIDGPTREVQPRSTQPAIQSPSTAGGSQGEQIIWQPADPIAELLGAWSASRKSEENDPMEEMAGKLISDGRMKSNADEYIGAAQLLVSEGNLPEAKIALDEVASMFPSVDGPHFELAELIYRLAIFDGIRRGLIHVEKVPTGSVIPSTLADGHLKLEIDELVGHGRPLAYRAALQAAGFNEKDEISIGAYLIAIDPRGLSPEAKAFLPVLVGKSGRPTYLLIPQWKPDIPNKAVLKLAQSEMRAAQTGSPLTEPTGMRIIDRERMAGLSSRIDELLVQ